MQPLSPSSAPKGSMEVAVPPYFSKSHMRTSSVSLTNWDHLVVRLVPGELRGRASDFVLVISWGSFECLQMSHSVLRKLTGTRRCLPSSFPADAAVGMRFMAVGEGPPLKSQTLSRPFSLCLTFLNTTAPRELVIFLISPVFYLYDVQTPCKLNSSTI